MNKNLKLKLQRKAGKGGATHAVDEERQVAGPPRRWNDYTVSNPAFEPVGVSVKHTFCWVFGYITQSVCGAPTLSPSRSLNVAIFENRVWRCLAEHDAEVWLLCLLPLETW